MICDLAHLVEREKAAMGFFVTLAPPTKPMITEAVQTGFYSSPFGNFPKIQILTIEGLLLGVEFAKYVDLSHRELNFRKAKKESEGEEQQSLLAGKGNEW